MLARSRHWTREQVADFFKPSETAVDAVREWLTTSGIRQERHRVSRGQGSVQFTATVAELERLLGTEYLVYEDSNTGSTGFTCEEYYVPGHIADHIEFVTPSLGLSKLRKRELSKRGIPSSGLSLSRSSTAGLSSAAANLSDCYQSVTPECIRG